MPNAVCRAEEAGRFAVTAVLAGRRGETFEDVGNEQVRLDLGGTRERLVGVALGLLRLPLRDRHAGARGQRIHPPPAGRCRHGLVGPRLDTVDPAPNDGGAMMFGAVAYRHGWPCVVGGSARLADGLASLVRSMGGRIETGITIDSAAQLAGFDYVLFDTGPSLPLKLIGPKMPARIRHALYRHRYWTAAFKLDIAVHSEIPWANHDARAAATVHVCGSYEEVVAAERDTFAGRMPERPFIIVAQHVDSLRSGTASVAARQGASRFATVSRLHRLHVHST
ncbi:MAG: hypothetical protein ACLQLO_24700 [Mycobacterium sp.]